MGKGRSPGKWFKNLLSGRKSSSKSNSSKKNDIFKLSSNKDVLGSSEVFVSDPTADPLVISAPISGANATNGALSEKNRSSHDRDIPSTGGEEAHTPDVGDFGSLEDPENIKFAEAAIKVQAACRGYQARRTFQRLRSVIQLQALIRGHLVRRQAVSALYCVKGIVKFQALARGYIVRRSDIGLAVLKIRKDTQCSNSIQVATSTQAERLSGSVFVHKLLASSRSAVPLPLSYDPGEPNLAWKWLDHWTRSHFWAPLSELKKKLDSGSDEKNGSSQAVKRRQVKRTTQKSPTVKADDGSISGSNKYKHRPKKDSNSSLLSAQEHTQKEIEKNIFKKNRLQNVSDRSEVVSEKRKHSTGRTLDHTVTDVSEQGPSASQEKMKEVAVSKSKESDPEKSLGQREEDKHDNEPNSLQKNRMLNVADRSEGVNEKRKQSTRKISDHTVTDVPEQGTSASSEKKKDLAVSKSKEPDHTVTDVSEQGTSASSEKKKDLAVSKSEESDPDKHFGQREKDKHDSEPSIPKKTRLQNVADRSEVVNEKKKHSTRKISDHTVTDVSEQGTSASSEKKKKDLAVSKSKQSDPEENLGLQEDKHDNEPSSCKSTHLQNVEDRSEGVIEKRKQSTRTILDRTADISEQGPNASSENKKELAVSQSAESDPERSIGQQAKDKHDNEPHNDSTSVLETSMTNGKNEGIQGVGEDLNGGDNYISNNCQRRASLPANFNDQDNELHSTPRLPSYMAPTESAKAKLRTQGSPRLATDFVDKNGVTRRHSLSSSLNGKSGSFSPRAERLVALSSRGAIRSDRSLSSSRDGADKLIQPQWRR